MKVLIVDENINTRESLTLGLNNSKKEFSEIESSDFLSNQDVSGNINIRGFQFKKRQSSKDLF